MPWVASFRAGAVASMPWAASFRAGAVALRPWAASPRAGAVQRRPWAASPPRKGHHGHGRAPSSHGLDASSLYMWALEDCSARFVPVLRRPALRPAGRPWSPRLPEKTVEDPEGGYFSSGFTFSLTFRAAKDDPAHAFLPNHVVRAGKRAFALRPLAFAPRAALTRQRRGPRRLGLLGEGGHGGTSADARAGEAPAASGGDDRRSVDGLEDRGGSAAAEANRDGEGDQRAELGDVSLAGRPLPNCSPYEAGSMAGIAQDFDGVRPFSDAHSVMANTRFESGWQKKNEFSTLIEGEAEG